MEIFSVLTSFHKSVIKHAPKYFSGSVFAAGLSLLMTKYYTNVFSPSEFGVLSLYLVMFKFVLTVGSLNLASSSTRLYFDYRDSKRDEYLSTIFWLITIVVGIFALFSLLLMPYFSSWISPGTESIYKVTLFSAIGAVYVSFLMRILYNEQLSGSVMKHTAMQSAVGHAVSVLFISKLNLGIIGRINGQALGYISNAISLLIEFKSKKLFQLKRTYNKNIAKETLYLTLPTAFAALQSFAFMYADRAFLVHYYNNSVVGIYSLGFMLGQGLSLVYEAISQAILPKTFTALKENYDEGRKSLEKFAQSYYMGLLAITVIISVLSPYIITLLSNENYSAASDVMPFIMLGFMMGGYYKIPSLILGFHKQALFYIYIGLISFAVNILFNFMLIPKYGAEGAAFSSFLGLFVYSFIMQFLSFKFTNYKYKLKTSSIYLITLIVSIFYFAF